ncbi:hypothetical protein LJK87_08560 [Paenibacillus sp. P25]|nr:hypothetical protein LJK87_08560 [Paenibacillus sp. P25]
MLVTHDITEAIAMSDRIVVLQPNPGRIRTELAVPEHIRKSPAAGGERAGGIPRAVSPAMGVF